MRLARNALILVSLVSLSITPATAVIAAPSAPSVPDFEPFASTAVQTSDEVQSAYEAVAEIIEQNPHGFTGVRIDGPNALTVTVPNSADVGARLDTIRLAAKAAGGTAVSVTIERKGRSRSDLEGVKEQIGALIRAGAHRDGIIGVGVDSMRGVATVYATSDSAAGRASLKKRFGDAIVFRQVGQPRFLESDRNRDTAAHFGGAGYNMWNDPHTGYRPYCSTAFPVVKDGVRYMLTAGHCMPGATSFPDAWATAFTTVAKPSIDYYFGTRYTTTMGGALGSPADGSQDQYGDWALLRGSTYLPYVYNCTNVTGYCSSLPVGTASWVLPSDNAAVCTSGRTTGQKCRQHVVEPSADAWIQGVYIRHLTMIRPDDGGCDTTRPGDSGGAVYQGMSSRPGYVRALGMVTAGDDCTSWYTRLSGVRAWNSSITMPVL